MQSIGPLLKGISLALLACHLVACRDGDGGAARLDRAVESHAAGDFSRAEIEYKNLLKADQGNVAALSGLGRIWLDRGVPLEAARLFGLARDRVPDDASVRSGFASALLACGYVGQARQEALEVLAGDPERIEALLVAVETSFTPEQLQQTGELFARHPRQADADVLAHRAILGFRQGDHSLARRLAERALGSEPGNVTAHRVLARVYWQIGSREEALAASASAARSGAERSPAKVEHAVLLIGCGKASEAENFLKQTTEAIPDFLPAWRMRAELARRNSDFENAQRLVERVLEISPLDFEGGLIQIELWLGDGEAERAIELAGNLRDVHPPQAAIEFGLARALLMESKRTLAREALERTLDLEPAHEGATLIRSRLQLAEGESGEAVKALEGLLAKRPGSIPAQAMLAEAYQASGRVDEAIRLFELQAVAGRDDFKPYLQLGLLRRNAGKPDAARAAFERADELAPGQQGVLGQLVLLDIAERKFGEAHGRLERFLTANPDAGGVHLLRAVVYFEEQQWVQSENSAQAAIDADPGILSAYGLLVRIHSGRGKNDRVVAELERLLVQAPDDHDALLRLGTLRQAQGNDVEARRNYERVLATRPESVPALNNLAMILAKCGADLAKAEELAARARSVAPGNPAVADTMGWIRFLQGDYQRALPLLKQAAAGLPDDPEVGFHLGMAAAIMDEPELAREALTRSILAEGDFPERNHAVERLERLDAPQDLEELRLRVKEFPGDPVDRLRLGEALARVGDAAAAVTEFQAALLVNPTLVKAHMGLAQLYSTVLGEPSKALGAARRARDLAPDDPAVAELIGRIAYLAGDHVWAHSLLAESMAKGRAGHDLLHQAAWAAYALGRVGEARGIMEQAAAIGANQEAEAARRFLAWTGANPPVDPDKNISGAPEDVPEMMAKAAHWEWLGKAEPAVTIYQEVLVMFPKFVPARISLARILVDDENYLEQVKDHLFQARQAMKHDPELLGLLGRVSFMEGDHAHAAQLLKQVELLGGRLDVMGSYILGAHHLEMEQLEKAGPYLESALAGGLREPEASLARAALAGKSR